jgi:hypothetical protein
MTRIFLFCFPICICIYVDIAREERACSGCDSDVSRPCLVALHHIEDLLNRGYIGSGTCEAEIGHRFLGPSLSSPFDDQSSSSSLDSPCGRLPRPGLMGRNDGRICIAVACEKPEKEISHLRLLHPEEEEGGVGGAHPRRGGVDLMRRRTALVLLNRGSASTTRRVHLHRVIL